MQNKGIVICVSVFLTLASIIYLSFSFATRYYDIKAAELKNLSLLHISEPTRLRQISYAVFCLKKKKRN